MAQNAPTTQYKFGPVNLYGNPIDRPDGSASLVRDFRVMPGNWLRLRGGRIARRNLTSALDVLQIQPISIAGSLGYAYHLAQVKYGSSDCRIIKVNISGGTVTFDETGIETLVHAEYSDLTSRCTPIVNLPDSVIFGNGWGYIPNSGGSDIVTPVPFFTQIDRNGTVRYFGLPLWPEAFDRTASSTQPTVQFNSGTYTPGSNTNCNTIATSITIHVGLYNTVTGHYSNTYNCGTLTTSGGYGTIRVVDAWNMNYATHGSTETAELKLVFYATLDGFEVPYLILKDTQDGPFTAAVGTHNVDLAITEATDNGWILDLTKRAPYNNYPPRQMSSAWYTNGRLYGILYEYYDNPGHNSQVPAPDPMEITDKDMASVCWSEAEGSSRTQDFVGDPLQSWPPNNISPVPSGERPLCGTAAPNNIDSVVWTSTHTFLLTEQADGIHEWTCIADSHGLYNVSNAGPKLFKKTRHGIMWVTQRKQIAIYRGGEEIEIVSQDYDPLLKSQTPTNAAYFYDPVNFVDRFQVFWSSGSVIHDFHTGGYLTSEPHEVRAGAMIANTSGDTYLVIAAGTLNSGMGIFSIEGQPDQSYVIPRVDQLFTGSSGQTTSTNELPEAVWIGNWEDFQDILNRKELQYLHLLGDGATSSTLSGGYPMRMEIFTDFSVAVSVGAGTTVNPSKEKQSSSDRLYKMFIANPHHRWWKFNLRMRSHYADTGSLYFADPSTEGDLSTNFYGAVMAMLFSNSANPNY